MIEKIAQKIMETIEETNPKIKGLYKLEFIPIEAEPKKKTLSDKLLVKSESIVMNNELDNPTGRVSTEKDVKEHLKDEENLIRDFLDKDSDFWRRRKEIFGERLI